MSSEEIVLKSDIINDEYTSYIYQAYDIQNTREVTKKVESPELPKEAWSIGLIYGNSGSGKTTIINHLGGEYTDYTMDKDRALVSNFSHMSEEDACRTLSSVGLSSVPSWLKPYGVLSNGEKFRADMAMKISGDPREITFVDEFTSVVNRDVAKAVSVAIRKYIRRNSKKVVFASCHDDIIEWLQPDWIYFPETGQMVKKKSTNNLKSSSTYTKDDMIRGRYLQTTTT